MIEVNLQILDQLSRDNEKVFVFFYTEWHDQSKMMMPNLKKLQTMTDIPITLCNSDYNLDLSDDFGVRGLPTFGLVVNGKIEKTDSMVKTLDYLLEFIEK